MKNFGERVADDLIEQGVLDPTNLDATMARQKDQGGRLLKILTDNEFVTETDVTGSTGRVLGIPPIDLSQIKVPKEVGDLISRDLASTRKLLPVARLNDVLYVAMADPANLDAIEEVRQRTQMEIFPLITNESMIVEAIRRLDVQAIDLEEDSDFEQEGKRDGGLAHQERFADPNNPDPGRDPVVRRANQILSMVVKERASDVHVECYEKSMKLRYRIDGALHDYPPTPKSLQNQLIARFKIMAGLNSSEQRMPQDGNIRLNVAGRDIDFRVSFLPSRYGETFVARILDRSALAGNIADLDLDPESFKIFRTALDEPQGMILVTGPTGSGKTRTLYNALAELNQPEYKIITVEDPIEYELAGINQVQVRAMIGFTFAVALRSILRQDPDIIMIGEMRDHETAHIGVEAAMTGHQVLSTLHTNDAASAVTRLTDLHIEPFLTASSLSLACAQRLLRRICAYCKDSVKVDDKVWQQLKLDSREHARIPYYKGRGCEKCKNSGYLGRCAVLELIPMTDEIRALVIEQASASKIKKVALKQGLRTLRMNALLKARGGITTLEEVLASTMSDAITD